MEDDKSRKISFSEAIEKVSPVPKTVSSDQKSSRGAQKAVILTSSPYKSKLEVRAIQKVRNKPAKKELFPKDIKCTKKIKKQKVEKVEKVKKIKKKPMNEKKGLQKKKKTEDLPSTSEKTARTNSDSWYCPLCQEEKFLSMIMCKQCKTWFHEECLGIEKGDKLDACHWCTDT